MTASCSRGSFFSFPNTHTAAIMPMKKSTVAKTYQPRRRPGKSGRVRGISIADASAKAMKTRPASPSLWPVDSAASTAGTYQLRAFEQPSVAAAASGAHRKDDGRGEQRDRPDHDQRVEQPRELAHQELPRVAHGAVQPSLMVRRHRRGLRREERHRDGRERSLADRRRA